MVKRELRKRITELKEIIDLWVKFNDLIREAHRDKSVTKEKEEEFLNIKTSLARKQQILYSTPLNLMNILNQATTLSDLIKLQDLQMKKFYADWHGTYLSLNELLGKLERGKVEDLVPRPVSRQKKRGHGCLYNFVLFIVFMILVYIGARIYIKKYDLKPRIREFINKSDTIQSILQKLGFESKVIEEEGKGNREEGEGK